MDLPNDTRRHTPADTVAGLLSALALFTALIGVAYRPVRVIPFAIVVALIAAAMSDRHTRLAQATIGISTACFVAGMIIAVLSSHPLF
jgi:hypothetical protein